MSLMDLELHANVTKYLTLKMFVGKLRGASRLAPADAAWVRQQIFDRGEFVAEDPHVRARYREASRLAARYVGALDELPASERVAALRRFHRMPPQAKVSHINALSAERAPGDALTSRRHGANLSPCALAVEQLSISNPTSIRLSAPKPRRQTGASRIWSTKLSA